MRRQLTIYIVLLCGTQLALGQRVIIEPTGGCGFERNTDLDGTYTSSTSTDQCATAVTPQQATSVGPLLSPNRVRDTRLIFPKFGFSGTLTDTLTQFDSLTLPKRFKIIAERKAPLLTLAQTAAYPVITGMVLSELVVCLQSNSIIDVGRVSRNIRKRSRA